MNLLKSLRKSLLVSLVLFSFGFAGNADQFVKVDLTSEQKATSLTLGYTETKECNSGSADVAVPGGTAVATAWQNCRAISCDVSGIVKITYKNDFEGSGQNAVTTTEVKYMVAGLLYPVRNVTTVYRYYTGTTAVTTQYYTSAGSLATGIKLHR